MTAPSSRLHAPVLTAPAVAADDLVDLRSPGVGMWRASVHAGEVVQAGETVGELTVLGVTHRVVAGSGARGAVRFPDTRTGAIAVDSGACLLQLDPTAVSGAAAGPDPRGATAAADGLTVRAPSSGRYYGRPAPGKPAFVSVGDVIREGHTVCLLEVMKTFNRVTYGGGGLPAEARVTAIAVADESDVNGGDVLLHLETV